MKKFEKLENLSLIILTLFILSCIIGIFERFHHQYQRSLKSKSDSISTIVSPEITRRDDPTIKAEQNFDYMDDDYDCRTYGWDHGEIVWSSHISGTFEYVKKQAKTEKKKCEDFLYGEGESVKENIMSLKQ